MVPYFQAHRGIAIDQAARDLGVTSTQLTKDLELLFVCGLPGYYPDDLIELEFSEGHVHVGFTAGMDRPLRLTSTEASTLLVALSALVDTPGVVDRDEGMGALVYIGSNNNHGGCLLHLISDWTVGPVGGHISVGAMPRSYQVTPAGPSHQVSAEPMLVSPKATASL